MPNIILAIVFFALADADVWGQSNVWFTWGCINIAIGCAFILRRQ